MSTPLRYKAFISYSHNDERWARWLHRALESFRRPQAARGQRPLRPVFRDRDELSASRDLSATIQNALTDSENLVVVCSVSAAQSRWVNAEVAEFIRLGRNDRIFCLFVDETPPDECLPDALRVDGGAEPLGADVHADGRRSAKLKLIAALLDVSYDTLRQRDKKRRRQQTIRFSAASVAAIGLVSLITYRVAVEPPCTNSASVFADVWNSNRIETMRQAFLIAEVPFGEYTIRVVLDALSTYASRWIVMHTEACEATMVRGEQSEKLMDLRMACLIDRRQRFDALAGQFLEGNRATVRNAVQATNRLGRLSRCADRTMLLAAYPPPEGAMVDTVARGRTQIAQLRALVDSSVALPALELAESTWQMLQDVDYPPVQAEALLLLGRAQLLGGHRAAAQSTFTQAASRAVTANDNTLAAEAWLSIPELVRERVHGAADARDMLALAKAYVERLPEDHPLWASYHANLGEVLVIQGEIEEGLAQLKQAVALARTGSDTKLPTYLNRLARIHAQHLEFESALPLIEESIELSSQYFGATHPAYAAGLQTLGGMYIDSGDPQKAIGYIEESLKIEQQAFPEIHPKIAATYAQLGTAFFRAVMPERAEELIQTSLKIYAEVGAASPIAVGDAHNNLGNVYSYLERFDESEYHLLEAARLWESVDFYRYSIVLNNLGSMVMGKDDYAAARDYCERALAADERQFSPDSPNIAYPLSCLGEALINLGEFDQAVTTLRRAYDIRSGRHESPLPMAHTRINLAMALWETGGDRLEIKEHYEFALRTVVEHDTGDEAALRSWAEGKDL